MQEIDRSSHSRIPEGTENTLTDELRKLDDYVYICKCMTELADGTHYAPGNFILTGTMDRRVGADPNSELKD